MKPFSDNVIFWDSEFSSLNPYKGELLSLGMVKPTGEELYFELDYQGDVDPWVQEHVLPDLKESKVSHQTAQFAMNMFIGDSLPYLVSYVNVFDAVYLYKFMGVKDTTRNFRFHWIQLDFAAMLFAMGINPERLSSSQRDAFCFELGIDAEKFKHHNALSDAKLLREVYLKLINSKSQIPNSKNE